MLVLFLNFGIEMVGLFCVWVVKVFENMFVNIKKNGKSFDIKGVVILFRL